MNPIRDKLLRTKALDEMERNASLEDLRCNISLQLSFEAKVNKGGTTPTGPHYSSTSEEWDISWSDMEEIKETDNLTKWVNNNYESRKGIIFLKYAGVKGKLYTRCDLYFGISHYGDDKSWFKNTLKITPSRYYDPLVNQQFRSGEVYLEPTQESAEIRPSRFDSDFEIVDSAPTKDSQSIDSLVVEFLSRDTPWIEGRFGNFKSSDNKLTVPLVFENTTYEVRFVNPDDISSPIWNLASIFDYEDPWNLEDEKFQLTFNPLCISSESYQEGVIHIRKCRQTKEYSIIDRVRSIRL